MMYPLGIWVTICYQRISVLEDTTKQWKATCSSETDKTGLPPDFVTNNIQKIFFMLQGFSLHIFKYINDYNIYLEWFLYWKTEKCFAKCLTHNGCSNTLIPFPLWNQDRTWLPTCYIYFFNPTKFLRTTLIAIIGDTGMKQIMAVTFKNLNNVRWEPITSPIT